MEAAQAAHRRSRLPEALEANGRNGFKGQPTVLSMVVKRLVNGSQGFGAEMELKASGGDMLSDHGAKCCWPSGPVVPGEVHLSRVLRTEVGGEPEQDTQGSEPQRAREKQYGLLPGPEERPFPETLTRAQLLTMMLS